MNCEEALQIFSKNERLDDEEADEALIHLMSCTQEACRVWANRTRQLVPDCQAATEVMANLPEGDAPVGDKEVAAFAHMIECNQCQQDQEDVHTMMMAAMLAGPFIRKTPEA